MAVLATLSGCASASPTPTVGATPAVTSKSAFASKEEALAAARVAYAKYLRAGDNISNSRGQELDQLQSLVTADDFKTERAGAVAFAASGVHTTGLTVLKSIELQDADLAHGRIAAYACVDYSDVRVFNKAGKNVTPPSRPDLQTWLVRFVGGPRALLIDGNGTWSGKSIC